MIDADVGKIKYCTFYEGDKLSNVIDMELYDVMNNQYEYSDSLSKVTKIIEDTLNVELKLEEFEIMCYIGGKAPVCSATYSIKGDKQSLHVGFDLCYMMIKD